MPTPSNNLVTFLPIGGTQHVYLTISGDWTISGGMEASVNGAEIPYTERPKLPTNLVYVSGTIFFWQASSPDTGGAPDVALANQWLVDCSPGRLDMEPGDTEPKAVTYRLGFADHRHAFRPPRGGRLMQGLGNPDPLGTATLRTSSELINACLTAMGVSASVPSTVNAVDAPRQLEWFNAHAPAELGKLLLNCGHVYCPYSGGGGSIQQLGMGTLPTLPAGSVASDVTASVVNRLPTTAIFTSGNEAVARTFTDAASGSNVPLWEFVAQDPANNYEYRTLTSIAALGSSPAVELAKGLPSVADKDRKLFLDQLYKIIRLKNDRFDSVQSPILRDVLYSDGKVDQPHLVATVAVQGKGGAWVNRLTRINASTVDGVGNLLTFDQRIGTVSGGTERADFDAFFTPLATASLKPTFSVEDWDATAGQKKYSVFGFAIGLGVGTMSENTARSQLAGYHPGTAVYDVPELREIYVNDGTNNRATLQTSALGMATALLVSVPASRVIEVRGFVPVEIDGRINEVRYSQHELLTTIIRDGWTSASQGRHDKHHSHPGHGSGSGQQHGVDDNPVRQASRTPHAAHARALPKQISRGGTQARTPAAPLSKTPPAATGFRPVVVTPTAAISGQTNRYTGTTRSGKINRTASGAFAASDLGAAGVAGDCVIWSYASLTLNQPVLGHAGPTDNMGKLLVYVNPGASLPTPAVKYRPYQAIDDSLTPGFYPLYFE